MRTCLPPIFAGFLRRRRSKVTINARSRSTRGGTLKRARACNNMARVAMVSSPYFLCNFMRTEAAAWPCSTGFEDQLMRERSSRPCSRISWSMPSRSNCQMRKAVSSCGAAPARRASRLARRLPIARLQGSRRATRRRKLRKAACLWAAPTQSLRRPWAVLEDSDATTSRTGSGSIVTYRTSSWSSRCNASMQRGTRSSSMKSASAASLTKAVPAMRQKASRAAASMDPKPPRR